MGHNIGISSSYYKPTEKEVLEDYQKAVDLLTVNDDNRLREKILSLEQKQNDLALIKQQHSQQMGSLREEMREEIKHELKVQNVSALKSIKPEILIQGIN